MRLNSPPTHNPATTATTSTTLNVVRAPDAEVRARARVDHGRTPTQATSDATYGGAATQQVTRTTQLIQRAEGIIQNLEYQRRQG